MTKAFKQMKLVAFRLPVWLLVRMDKARLASKLPPSKQMWAEHVLTEGLTQVELDKNYKGLVALANGQPTLFAQVTGTPDPNAPPVYAGGEFNEGFKRIDQRTAKMLRKIIDKPILESLEKLDAEIMKQAGRKKK